MNPEAFQPPGAVQKDSCPRAGSPLNAMSQPLQFDQSSPVPETRVVAIRRNKHPALSQYLSRFVGLHTFSYVFHAEQERKC
jgi:hypothetical protein